MEYYISLFPFKWNFQEDFLVLAFIYSPILQTHIWFGCQFYGNIGKFEKSFRKNDRLRNN